MKTIMQAAFQGDVLLRRVDRLPKEAVEVAHKGRLIVAHSETGHDHAVDDTTTRYFEVPGDPLRAYLVAGSDAGIDVVHHRPWDTHETLRLLAAPGAVWEIKRQREWTPEGWRRVED